MTDTKQRGYWREYEWRRRAEALTARGRTRLLRRAVRRAAPAFAAAAGATPGRLEAGVVILLDRAGGDSYRGMAARLAGSAGLRRRYGLTYAPSKSTLHAAAAAVAAAGKAFMDAVLAATVSGCRERRLHGDSTGFGLRRYVEWRSAKYGDMSVRDFVKLHVLAAAHGPILAFEATPGRAHDSPAFRKMMARMPDGPGMVALDAAYYADANCEAIVRSGRVPVIMPRANAAARGYTARARMTRWYREDPGGFMMSYGVRSLAESVFSSMKERTGATVRARSLAAQTAELFARVLCHNLTV